MLIIEVRGRSRERVISYSMGLFPDSIHQLKARFRCHWARECHGIENTNSACSSTIGCARLRSKFISSLDRKRRQVDEKEKVVVKRLKLDAKLKKTRTRLVQVRARG